VNDPESRIRATLAARIETPGAAHDAAVLAAARAYASERRAKPRWYVPVSLAASLAIGVLVGRATDPGRELSAEPTALFVPLEATRGSASRSIPVEQADADVWYRYIQELVAAGERREAAAHLERFNALHPDYVYQP
jgi:hypothetical protein